MNGAGLRVCHRQSSLHVKSSSKHINATRLANSALNQITVHELLGEFVKHELQFALVLVKCVDGRQRYCCYQQSGKDSTHLSVEGLQ